MAFDPPSRGAFCQKMPLIAAIVTIALWLSAITSAHAERSAFRTYGTDQGFASLFGSCISQDPAGDLMVCTQHGVFTYDGRRFVNLGTQQGLRAGGRVYDLAITSGRRLAVGFADEVFVSDRPSDPAHPPSSLSFRAVSHPGISFYEEKPHRIAPWLGGLALLASGTTVRVVVPQSGPSHVETMGYDLSEEASLRNPAAIFSVRGHLWEAFDDGRLCDADPSAVMCYSSTKGLRGGPWVDVVAGPDGSVLARSAAAVATLNPGARKWSVVDLPDQGGRYLNYSLNLGLFRTPNGGIVTQADHGLAVLGPKGWHLLSVEDGAPAGTILSAMTDATDQLWFQVFGRGLVRWVGYGNWQQLQKAEGLSSDIAWETARTSNGSTWVSTDTGVDEIVRQGSYLRVGKVVSGASFALAIGPRGRIWSGFGSFGVRIIDPSNGSITKLDMPPVNKILPGRAGTMWLGTQKGMFRVDDRPDAQLRPVLVGSPSNQVRDLVGDGSGGLWYLSAGRLHHRHENGMDLPVTGVWPGNGFQPLALALGNDGELWIGGYGGLFRVVVSHDRISAFSPVPVSDTQNNTVLAVMLDHRGWVWAGTPLGVSVFDGRDWVSIDTNSGLVSDDVAQDGLREDPDGSVWIATSQGVSHLLDPSRLFANRSIKVVVSSALLGSRPVSAAGNSYTNAPLALQFGTPNYGVERSVIFRYRLSGVDAGWVESPSGVVRYAFVPPGDHVLTVLGYDELSHQTSAPATLVIDMGYPWWNQWWSDAVWAVCAIGAAYGFYRIRYRVVLAGKRELKRQVSEATAVIQYQAAHDRLTGLLSRCEVERRLAERLANHRATETTVVALVDIDHFKRVNDRYGHLGGDDVLRAMGTLISGSLRDHEYAGRYGGEEVLIVLDDSDGRGAERILKLHLAIRRDTFNASGSPINVTCSIGLAWTVAGDNWESLIGRADDALYEAKESGRDRVTESRLIHTEMRKGDQRRSTWDVT